jgi:hypothetical protein
LPAVWRPCPCWCSRPCSASTSAHPPSCRCLRHCGSRNYRIYALESDRDAQPIAEVAASWRLTSTNATLWNATWAIAHMHNAKAL